LNLIKPSGYQRASGSQALAFLMFEGENELSNLLYAKTVIKSYSDRLRFDTQKIKKRSKF
jgi:hypothetical protein